MKLTCNHLPLTILVFIFIVIFNLQDIAKLRIRDRMWMSIDLVRQSDGTYKNSKGMDVPNSQIVWGGNNPHFKNENNLGIGYKETHAVYDINYAVVGRGLNFYGVYCIDEQ